MKRQRSWVALWFARQSGLACAALVWAAVAASEARAATVTYALVSNPNSAKNGCVGCTLNGPGTWDLYASASHGDHFGIAHYYVTLANTLTILHRSPQTALTTDPDGVDPEPQPAGFKLLRSVTNDNPITGSQDTVTDGVGTPYVIRGFGQTASSFQTQFPGTTEFAPSAQTTWAARLLIAEGTYAVGGTLPSFGPVAGTTTAGVFANASGTNTMAAHVVLVPEPATLTLFGLAMVGIAGMVRCMRGRDHEPHRQGRENS